MTTTKKDTVIEALETYLESHRDSEAAKLMLYANPNGSGLLGENPKGLPALRAKVAELNASGVFDPEGLQLPLVSLGIEARMRHTIDELLTRIEIANLMRAHLYVAHTKGVEWPPKPVIIPNMDMSQVKMPPVIKIPTIKAIKAAAKDALVNQLPTIVGLCYTAKYKSSSTFSYNLAETKFYTLNSAFIKKALHWVGARLGLVTIAADGSDAVVATSLSNDASMFAAILGGVDDNARERLVFDEWFKYSYSKPRDSHSYPPAYEKLARAITARIGKILFASTSDDDYNAGQVEYAKSCLGSLGFDASILKDKKKELQLKVVDKLLMAVRNAYAASSGYTVGTVDHKNSVRSQIQGVVGMLSSWIDGLGIESALVGLDVFVSGKAFYSKGDFLTVMEALSQTGICNDRVINAIYKFISTASLLDRDHSRKTIDPSIELVLARTGDLSRIKTDNTDEPSIVFSHAALAAMPHEQRMRFEHLHDKKGSTGYVQKGVMSITSSLKQDKDSADLPRGFSADQVRLVANYLDEMANIYALYAEPTFDSRKKASASREAEIKLMKKHGITGGGSPQYFQQQPAAFVPVSVSPSQVPVSSVFSEAVPMFGATQSVHEHHRKSPSPIQVAAPSSLFGAAPMSPPQAPAGLFGAAPVAHHSPAHAPAPAGLFGAVPSSPGQMQGSSLFGAVPSSPGQMQGSSLFGAVPSSPGQMQGSSLFGGAPGSL